MLSAIPLITLPWWSDHFPDALRTISKDLAGVVGDMIGGIDRTREIDVTRPRCKQRMQRVDRDCHRAQLL